jgi:outer membrane protein assembly factor BamB
MRELLSAGLALLSVATAGRADDWPQWLGPQRDAVWRETGILQRFPERGPAVLWRAPVGAGYSGPAVANGCVYVTDRRRASTVKDPGHNDSRRSIPGNERVLCLGAADGRTRWVHEYDCPYGVQFPLGPRATPLVRDGKVYALGAEGNLFCLLAASGKVLWSHDLKREYATKSPLWGYAAHPLLDGRRLICMVGGRGSTVVAFDKDSGKELWRALDSQELGYCPPVIYEAGGRRQLIVWHGEAVNSLDPATGRLYWSHPVKTFMGMAIAMPRRCGDLLYVTPPYHESVMLRLKADEPAADVVWHGGPKRIGFDSCFGTPFPEGDYLYGTSAYGSLRCIRAQTGERQWSTLKPNKGYNRQSSDVFIVRNGDRFFLYTEQGDLIIARLRPQGYEQISRAHLLDPTWATHGREVLWSHPAFANRCVYARNDREIICVSLSEPSAP